MNRSTECDFLTLELIKPNSNYQESYSTYIVELGGEERYPFPLDFDHGDFPTLLRRLEDFETGTNIPDGYVPSSTFWLVDGSQLIGVSSLRHHLNEKIRHAGGHIGLGIRPSFRGKGLSNRLLELTIQEARKRGIETLHVHCHKHNVASARMIISNGGKLDSEITEDDSTEVVQRYIIS